MLKKIIIAVALSFGVVSSDFAVDPKKAPEGQLVAVTQHDALLASPEAKEAIKQQVTQLIQANHLPAIGDKTAIDDQIRARQRYLTELMAIEHQRLQSEHLKKIEKEIEAMNKKMAPVKKSKFKAVVAMFKKPTEMTSSIFDIIATPTTTALGLIIIFSLIAESFGNQLSAISTDHIVGSTLWSQILKLFTAGQSAGDAATLLPAGFFTNIAKEAGLGLAKIWGTQIALKVAAKSLPEEK